MRHFPQQWLFQLWSSGSWYDVFLQLNRYANVSEKYIAPVLRAGLGNSKSTKNRECHYPVLTALRCWSFVLKHRQQNKTLDPPPPIQAHLSTPTPDTWLRLLCIQTNTGTSNALSAETHWPACTLLRAFSRLVTQLRLTSITCAWSWRLCEINPAIHSSSSQISPALLARCNQWDFLYNRLCMYKNMLFVN